MTKAKPPVQFFQAISQIGGVLFAGGLVLLSLGSSVSTWGPWAPIAVVIIGGVAMIYGLICLFRYNR